VASSTTGPLRLTKLYIATLLGLAVLLTVGQLITQWQFDKFQDEILLIRNTALQRHQSQQIAKKALLLNEQRDIAAFKATQKSIQQLEGSIRQHFVLGQKGFLSQNSPSVVISDTIQQLYRAAQPYFNRLDAGTRTLMSLAGPSSLSSSLGKQGLHLVLTNDAPFLERIDAVVQRSNHELRQKLASLQRFEQYLYILTLAVLAAIAWFVYRPAARRLRATVAQLVTAEQRTTEANRKLTSVNSSLNKARQQLVESAKQQFQLQINEQKSRTAYLVAGQEEERKRLSRELHDGLGQMLTAIKLQVEGLDVRLTNSGVSDHNIPLLKHLISQTIQEARSISNNLMPSALSDFGLMPALRVLAEQHNRLEPGMVTLEADRRLMKPAAERLAQPVEITLYRVTQEALTNAIRHGKATHIGIHLFEKDQYLHLSISDNGAGFKTQRLNKEPHGQGVHNMHERVKLVNGTFKLTSVPGKGTKLKVSIPYHSQELTHDYDKINVG
jgi:signal transduction histidine kinase